VVIERYFERNAIMKTLRFLSAASGAVLALSLASAGFGPSAASAQDYGSPPPPPPSYEAPPPPPSYEAPPTDYVPPPTDYAPPSDYPNRSLLKVCKVAKGIPVGTMFTFYTKPGGQKQSITVPAGPAPGGYCQVVGEYAAGSQVALHEYLPRGFSIVSIRTEPAEAELSQDRSAGVVMLRLPRGVTEVTWVQTGTGWIEICKEGGRPGQTYSFSFMGINGPRTETVLAGACTPAFEVPAGNLVVTEANAQGQMTGGAAWPANRFVSAEPSQGRITVRIDPGGTIQTQTLITFRNRAQGGKGY
jgi:hypothetical protein